MKLEWKRTHIQLEKELNSLDMFVIDFTKLLDEMNIKYVLVSGYVAILFGRSRSSEDIDMMMETVDESTFSLLWNALKKRFWCLNTSISKEAFVEYLNQGLALRFAYQNTAIPNMEVKLVKNELDDWTLSQRQKVKLNNTLLHISPLELQIPFKLFLGSQKDMEDARYLNNIFKDKLNRQMLHDFARKLKIEQELREYL